MRAHSRLSVFLAPVIALVPAAVVVLLAYFAGESLFSRGYLGFDRLGLYFVLFFGALICLALGPPISWYLYRTNKRLFWYVLWGLFLALFSGWRLQLWAVGLPFGALLGFFTWAWLHLMHEPLQRQSPGHSDQAGPAS